MNSYAMLAREKKARAYAEYFRKHAVKPEQIADLDDETWRLLANHFGLRPPSEKTKKLIAEMLREK